MILKHKKNPVKIIIVILFLVAVLIRAYGLDSHREADESYEIKRAFNVLEGEFNWSRIAKGGLYILLVPLYSIGKVLGQDYSFYLLVGRIVQVLIGGGLIVFLFLILKKLYGNMWAVFFTIPPLISAQLIYSAHHINVQNLMFLCVIIHLYFIFMYSKENNEKYLGFSLIALAVAAASQLSAIVIGIPLIILILIQYFRADLSIKRSMRSSILRYGLIALAVYIIMTPGIIIHMNKTFIFIANRLKLRDDLEANAGTPASYFTIKHINLWSAYLKYSISFYGKLCLALLGLSVLCILWKKKWQLLYPFSILISFYFILVNTSKATYEGRYFIPGLLMGYAIMPFAVVRLSEFLKKYGQKVRYTVLVAIILIITVYFGRMAYFSFGYIRQFGLPDTRIIATDWLVSNTDRNDRILLENTCNFPKVPYEEQAFYIENWNAYPSLDSVNVDYIVVNKNTYLYVNSKNVDSSFQEFYENVIRSREWELVYSIEPIKNEMTGPQIEIYKHNMD